MKKVLLLIAQGVEPLEMSAITDVFGWANLVGNDAISVIDAGFQRQVKTTFGLNLNLNYLVNELNLDDYDALAIPGGFEPSGFYEDALSEPFLAVIRHFHQAQKTIASVCVSSLALGEAGVLKGKHATVYHQKNGTRKVQLEASGAIFVDQALVCDSNIITSTGPGTAIEVAFALLARLTSENNANKVREKMRIPALNLHWLAKVQVAEIS